jgi:hypothetical protein
MIALSPSTIQRLDHWLETDPDRFEKYLRAHPEVADVYENMNSISTTVRTALQGALESPIDIVARFWDRTAERTDTAQAAVVLDLLGVGLATLKTLVIGDL